MTRRAFAGKQELTPPPARLDQRSNLSPCSRPGPYEFLGKKKPISRRSCHKVMPPRRKTGTGRTSKGSAFAAKPGKCRAFQFSVTSYC